MPSTYEFPYVRFHGRSYPLVPLSISWGKIRVNTFGLLDSGASFSVFRPEIAEALEIPLKKQRIARLGTAKGKLDIGISRVRLKVNQSQFSADVGFSRSASTSFNIIGRDGFFPRFTICFDEKMKKVFMKPKRSSK